MQLIGMLDSPYVRRVAISMKLMGLPFEHKPVSVFRHFDQFRQINPLVKAPTLVCDDGEILMDSTLILDYLDTLVTADRSLMPSEPFARRHALQNIGVALVAFEKVRTPLLILHNDADDAVPWYQGIELFLALRRYEKPAWLFNYNGQLHGLRRRADLKDFGKRMHQFFDHYLKGAPAPEWMEKGIPYLERDEEKIRFNAKPAKS